MNHFFHHAIAAIVAGVVSVTAAVEFRASPQKIVQTRQARIVTGAWASLPQDQINKITHALNAMGNPPDNVTIVCIKAILCDEFELDLENAFESAHWKTINDTLVFGDALGLVTNDKRIAEAITNATGMPVKFDDSSQRSVKDRIAALGGTAPSFSPRLIIGRNKESVQ